jgi:opacity protein-like surface antigen
MKKIAALVLTGCVLLSPAHAAEFVVVGEAGVITPQQEAADYYRTSFAYGGALQVSFSGPKNLELGIRGELFYSSLRPKTETAGLENSFSLMPVIGNAVVSVPLGNDFKVNVLGGVGFYRNDWTIGTESDDQFYMGYNGGLEFDMAVMRGLAVGLQTRYHLVTGCQGESDDKYLTTLFVIKMHHAHGSDHH